MLTSRSQMMMLGKKNTRADSINFKGERGREETRIRGVETLQPANSADGWTPGPCSLP